MAHSKDVDPKQEMSELIRRRSEVLVCLFFNFLA